jgi:putative hydrolase
MVERMLAAVRNPLVDVLGHCTAGNHRPRSPSSDREKVSPRPLQRGCVFAIDTDCHAPGQLDRLGYGCPCQENGASRLTRWSTRTL